MSQRPRPGAETGTPLQRTPPKNSGNPRRILRNHIVPESCFDYAFCPPGDNAGQSGRSAAVESRSGTYGQNSYGTPVELLSAVAVNNLV